MRPGSGVLLSLAAGCALLAFAPAPAPAPGHVVVRKVRDGICAEVAILAAYEAMARRWAGVERGTCAEAGYSQRHGELLQDIPFSGQVTAPLYRAAECEAGAESR